MSLDFMKFIKYEEEKSQSINRLHDYDNYSSSHLSTMLNNILLNIGIKEKKCLRLVIQIAFHEN